MRSIKSIFTVLIIFVAVLSFVVCNRVSALEADEIEVANLSFVEFEVSDEFEITKMDRCVRGDNPEYSMVCKNEDCSFICIINVETYVTLEVGDTVSGNLIARYDATNDSETVHFITSDNKVFSVEWCSRHK